MLFITNRALNEGFETVPGRSISFRLDDNSVQHSLYYCQRTKKDDYTELGSLAFLASLKDSAPQQVLIYIHGYSNLPEPDIFPRAAKLQKMCDAKEKGLVQVVPIIWPCDNDLGIVKDYWDDQKAADASGFSFSRLLERFEVWRNENQNIAAPCLKRMNVLAHSMGNRVLRESMRLWAKYDRQYRVPLLFRNTFMVAADVVNEALHRGESGQFICDASRNVIVYYASDDLALRASKVSNLKNAIASRRLGHSGPEDMRKVPSNVYAVDCDDYNTKYDYPKGHSYFLEAPDKKPGVVFEDIFRAIQLGRVYGEDPDQRSFVL
jgi:esterase/lipase superfamily enzyme